MMSPFSALDRSNSSPPSTESTPDTNDSPGGSSAPVLANATNPKASVTPAPSRRWLSWGSGFAGLLAVALGAAFVCIHPQKLFWASGAAQHQAATSSKLARIERVEADTLTVPADVAWSLGIRTAEATAAVRPRPLPSLMGCLAVDNDRLVRVHSRFAGEMMALGTLAKGETAVFVEDGPSRMLRVGDRVEEGQLLAVVWSKDLGEKKSELVDSLSRLRVDRETLDRLKSVSEGVVAGRQVREAERAVEASQIAVARAEATLRSWRVPEAEIQAVTADAQRLTQPSRSNWPRVEVRASMAGVILEKNTSLGDVVDTTMDLFKIADLSKLHVWAQVYEDDLPALQALPRSIPWTVSVPSRPGYRWTGTLEHIGEIIDPNQHTALVRGSVDNPRGELKVGQFITAVVALPPGSDEVEVPTSALIEDGKESLVFVQTDPQVAQFTRRRVNVVRRQHDVIYLHSPVGMGTESSTLLTVRPGERVVVGGAIHLHQALEELPRTE